MIREVRLTYFIIECDMACDKLCHQEFEGEFEENIDTVVKKAKSSGWLSLGGKYLCPSCTRK